MTRRITAVLALFALFVAPVAMADTAAHVQSVMDQANASLAASGSDIRVAYAEWITASGDSAEAGSTVFYKNTGNKQLAFDFVPFDPRRTWNPTAGFSYLVDQSDGATLSGLPNAVTEPAIDAAMTTWDVDTACSDLPMFKYADSGADPDLIDFSLGFGPPPGPGWPYADLVHGGWTLAFAPPILGVTFTFGFTNNGVFTDINNDGKIDAALREIYYSSYYFWNIGSNIDVETIALHEAGHGLSQGHFGSLSRTEANGKFHFSPLAVMNAGYTQVQQDLKPTDLAGHCSIWGNWPNN